MKEDKKEKRRREKETKGKVSAPASKWRPTGSTSSFAAAIISRNSRILLSSPHSHFLSDCLAKHLKGRSELPVCPLHLF